MESRLGQRLWRALAGVLVGLSMCTAVWAQTQVCASPGAAGDVTISAATTTVNRYYRPANGTYSGAGPTISISGGRGAAGDIAVGDLVLLIQMQCADINRTDTDSYGDGVAGFPASGYTDPATGCRAGQYEFVRANTGSSATSLVVTGTLLNTYEQLDPDGGTGRTRRSFQVIRVPQYRTLTFSGAGAIALGTAARWDGFTGGVVALDVQRDLSLGGTTIDVAGRGFRGAGTIASSADGNNPFRCRREASGCGAAHAGKAEGIAGTPQRVFIDDTPRDGVAGTDGVNTDLGVVAPYGYPANVTSTVALFWDYAKGAPGNAGGGGQYRDGAYHNGGGGGGGNGGAGGRGGYGWRSAGWAGVLPDYSNIVAITGDHLAAFGGAAFGGAGAARLAMGGGGGGGDHNGNSANDRVMAGAPGGGIVMIRAGSLNGSATINAQGGIANNNPDNDAAGAGGAGGSVLVISPNWTSGLLTINTDGGRGGDSWIAGSSAHSGGGGGGGGVVVRSGGASLSLSGGANGTTNTGGSPPGGVDHGATPGNFGVDVIVNPATNDPITNSGWRCTPQVALSLAKAGTPTAVTTGDQVTWTLVLTNSGPDTATASTVLDTFPAGFGTITFVSATGSNPAATLTANSLVGSTFNGTATVPANQTLTLVFRATAASNGTWVNTASFTAPPAALSITPSNGIGSATVIVGPSTDLASTKVASTPSVTVSGTTNFTLTYVNLGPDGATGARLTDTLPSGLGSLAFVSSSGSGGASLTANNVAGSVFTGTATLPTNSTLTVVIRAVGVTAGSWINTTTVAPPLGVAERNPSNNVGTASVIVGAQADLSVSKTATPTTIRDGVTTQFTITIRNTGPQAATAATVRDQLPSGLTGLTFISATSFAGGTLTARANTTSVFDGTLTLPANSSVSIVIQAIGAGTGVQVNSVTVTAPVTVTDPTLSNNVGTVSVVLPVPASLSITKTNNLTAVVAGQTTSYSITVANGGPNAANGAVLTDPATTGLDCISVSCSATGGAICPASPAIFQIQGSGVVIPTFPSGSSLVFTLVCRVTATGR